MNEHVFENIPYFRYAALLFAALFIAALLRFGYRFFERLRAMKHLQYETEFTEEAKAEFKCRIHRSYLFEEHRNRDKLKRQINKAVLIAQSYQFQKLHHALVIGIIRRTLLEFRSRFFKNLRLALIQKAKKQKGSSGHLTHMQQEAIREMMFAMGLKNKRTGTKETSAEPQIKENYHEGNERPHETNTLYETERERRQCEWMEQETRIKELQASLKRKNLDKPPEIRKAAVSTGYYAKLHEK